VVIAYFVFIARVKIQDDEKLVAIIERDGIPDDLAVSIKWTDVASQLQSGRTAKQCRDRWFNHLRRGIKKGGWTKDEGDLINDLYSTFGGR
jgi:Myb-like DNA-binding domain